MDGLPVPLPTDETQLEDYQDGPRSHPLSLAIEDYIFRGDELEDYSIYELACTTCTKRTTALEKARYMEASNRRQQNETFNWNRRVQFQSGHSKGESRWTSFLKSPKVPCIVGKILRCG